MYRYLVGILNFLQYFKQYNLLGTPTGREVPMKQLILLGMPQPVDEHRMITVSISSFLQTCILVKPHATQMIVGANYHCLGNLAPNQTRFGAKGRSKSRCCIQLSLNLLTANEGFGTAAPGFLRCPVLSFELSMQPRRASWDCFWRR